MLVTEMTKDDFDNFWPIFKTIIEAEETYAFDPGLNQEQAYQLWCTSAEKAFVIKEGNEVLGTYYIRPNAAGPSSHISNCGYMVSPKSRGKGIAKTLCLHSQKTALALGYTAMQFNSVVSSNIIAIGLWEKLGFVIIGTIPNAYDHKTLGLIDSYIMHKQLN